MRQLTDKDINELKATVPVIVGAKICNLRLKKGLTQIELANRIYSDRQYLYKIEKGLVGLSVVKLVVIAKALGVTPSSLLE